MECPSVSVILPVRNEATHIRSVLDAVLQQDYPPDRMEVLVVDGMSDDGTRAVIEEYEGDEQGTHAVSGKANVRLIDNPERIVPTAMNRGIRAARGDIIVRVDGHAVIETDYVKKNVQGLLDTGADNVGGIIESVGTTYIGSAIAAVMSSRFGVGGSAFRTMGQDAKPREVDTVPFGAFPRRLFERIGLFNEHLVRHQDYEFNYRIRAAGGKIVLLPQIKSVYYVRPSMARFFKQYWQYGIWKGRFLRCYPQSLKLRHMVPPLLVLALMGSILLSVVSPFGWWLLLGVLGAYMGFLIAAVVDAIKRGVGRYAPMIPLLLPMLHLGWGSGVLCGLLLPRIGPAPDLLVA
jgi:succinoglycan biosynthesis protein ExoA